MCKLQTPQIDKGRPNKSRVAIGGEALIRIRLQRLHLPRLHGQMDLILAYDAHLRDGDELALFR